MRQDAKVIAATWNTRMDAGVPAAGLMDVLGLSEPKDWLKKLAAFAVGGLLVLGIENMAMHGGEFLRLAVPHAVSDAPGTAASGAVSNAAPSLRGPGPVDIG